MNRSQLSPGMQDQRLGKGVQYDARGVPYTETSDGTRTYLSPVAFGGETPEDQSGLFHKRPQWNQHTGAWETPFDWGAIANLIAGGGLAAGGLSAAGVFGAGGSGAGGGLPGLGADPAGEALGAAGLGADPAGEAIGGTLGAGGAGGASGLSRTAALTAGQRALRGGLLGGSLALGGALGGGSQDMSPELRRLFELQHQRLQAQNPLYQSILGLAFNRMPTASRAGVTAPSLASATAQTPPVGPGRYGQPQELRQAFHDQEIRQRMSDPVSQAILAMSAGRLPHGGV